MEGLGLVGRAHAQLVGQHLAGAGVGVERRGGPAGPGVGAHQQAERDLVERVAVECPAGGGRGGRRVAGGQGGLGGEGLRLGHQAFDGRPRALDRRPLVVGKQRPPGQRHGRLGHRAGGPRRPDGQAGARLGDPRLQLHDVEPVDASR